MAEQQRKNPLAKADTEMVEQANGGTRVIAPGGQKTAPKEKESFDRKLAQWFGSVREELEKFLMEHAPKDDEELASHLHTDLVFEAVKLHAHSHGDEDGRIHVDAFPKAIRDLLRTIDTEQEDTVSADELDRVIAVYQARQNRKVRLMIIVIFFTIFTCVILVFATAGSTAHMVEESRPYEIDEDDKKQHVMRVKKGDHRPVVTDRPRTDVDMICLASLTLEQLAKLTKLTFHTVDGRGHIINTDDVEQFLAVVEEGSENMEMHVAITSMSPGKSIEVHSRAAYLVEGDTKTEILSHHTSATGRRLCDASNASGCENGVSSFECTGPECGCGAAVDADAQIAHSAH